MLVISDLHLRATGPQYPAAELPVETHGIVLSPGDVVDENRGLPRATTTEVAYRNPYSGEWTETDQHVALVEPSRLVAEAEENGGP